MSSKDALSIGLSLRSSFAQGMQAGRPFSPYVCIIVSEILAESLRANTDIEGIRLYEIKF